MRLENPASPRYVGARLGFAFRLTVAEPSHRLPAQRPWCIITARTAIGARVGGRLKTLQICSNPAALSASPTLSEASVLRASPASLASPAFGASLSQAIPDDASSRSRGRTRAIHSWAQICRMEVPHKPKKHKHTHRQRQHQSGQHPATD